MSNGKRGRKVLIVGCSAAMLMAIGVIRVLANGAGYQSPEFANALPASKARLLQQEDARINQARSAANSRTAAALKSQGAAPANDPVLPYPSGIIDSADAPFSPQEFIVNNRWAGVGGSEGWLVVYAGGSRTDPGGAPDTVAAVRVITMSPNPNLPANVTELGTFPAPTGTSLTITAATGPLLTLLDDTGQSITFNTETDQFS